MSGTEITKRNFNPERAINHPFFNYPSEKNFTKKDSQFHLKEQQHQLYDYYLKNIK